MIKADPASALLLYVSQNGTNTIHGAGQIHFDTRPPSGPGGTILYIPRGDNANIFDCCMAVDAQSLLSDEGKLLALDVDATPNPTTMPTIAALGLRNPWGSSVDRGDSAGQGRGDVYMGDVGEQITGSVLRWIPTSPVENFGWPWLEGNAQLADTAAPALRNATCFSHGMCGAPSILPTIVPPFEVHSDIQTLHDALIGGCVYRGGTVLSLQNHYVYATFQSVALYRLDPQVGVGGILTRTPIAQSVTSAWQNAGLSIHSINQDGTGELLVVRVDPTATGQNGDVFRITP